MSLQEELTAPTSLALRVLVMSDEEGSSSRGLAHTSLSAVSLCGGFVTTEAEPNEGAEITTEPRINDRIRTPQIRLINYTG